MHLIYYLQDTTCNFSDIFAQDLEDMRCSFVEFEAMSLFTFPGNLMAQVILNVLRNVFCNVL